MRKFLVAALIVSGCGPSISTGPAKLPPAKTEAKRALEDAVRQIKLGPMSYARARERLEAARVIDPGLWESWYDTGWIYQQERELDKAADAYERALKINPGHAATASALGSVYLQRHKFSDAARIYRHFLEVKPPPPPALERSLRIQLASALRQSNELDAAIEELRKVLRTDGRSAPALSGLALVYQAKKQHELAELVVRRAVEVADKDKIPSVQAATYNDLGLVLLSLRRDQEAFAAFDKAAALDPQLPEARYNRAAVYLDCGDYGSALKELSKLTDTHVGNVPAWVALGVAQRGLGKLDEARHSYEKALSLDANDAGALYNMGVLLMDFKKEPAQARPYFERFMHASDYGNPKRGDADERLKEIVKSTAPAPAPKVGG
jgi:Tfp pilus assembly protein PilF